jgi:hypothetical protein
VIAGIVVAAVAAPVSAQPYSARRNGDVVQLEDAKAATQTEGTEATVPLPP